MISRKDTTVARKTSGRLAVKRITTGLNTPVSWRIVSLGARSIDNANSSEIATVATRMAWGVKFHIYVGPITEVVAEEGQRRIHGSGVGV